MKTGILNPAERASIKETLEELFTPHLEAGETLEIEGELDGERVFMSLRLANEDRSSVVEFDVASSLSEEAKYNAVEARAILVEFLAGYLEEWFRSERTPHPHLEWREYHLRQYPLYLRGRTLNERVEALADAFLAEAGFAADGDALIEES